MTETQENINNKVKTSNFIHNKIETLFNTAEETYNKTLLRPGVFIGDDLFHDKKDNVLYLNHENLINENELNKILERKITTIISKQIFGKEVPSFKRRQLRLKLGIKVNLRKENVYEKWDWSLNNSELARKYNYSRERTRQLRELLKK